MTGSVVSPSARVRVRELATPVALALGRVGLSPNALTVIGFLGTCVAAFAAANQSWLAAGALVLVFGIFDLFDGALARATNQVSRLGAFLDSTFDRAGEAIVYFGLIAGLQASGVRDAFVFAAAAMATAFLVSYVRAKSESLGFTPGTRMANVGLMPREVRTGLLGAALIIAGLVVVAPSPTCTTCARGSGYPLDILVIQAALAIIAFGSIITVIQRVLHVRAQAREG
jgi:phosphatidylglycerophosphate synthase